MPPGQLPTGTVTFLFTDIEGSTKLWEEHPQEMRAALARHNSLVQEAIWSARGHVFKTVGDAFCAVFAAPSDAVAAALAAQIAVSTEPWPAETPIRVRMALHTGEVDRQSDDYFGQPVNRVARLLATAHGGQTLLSKASCELVGGELPQGVSVRDLGVHRLKDLAGPEQVFQLEHSDLPGSFPPIRSLSTHPNNLPQQMTSFVGRETEIGEVESLMSGSRLMTLTGSGGSGKTRLSLHVAADSLERFPDGVWLVELASLGDPGSVPQAVARVLGFKDDHGGDTSQTLIAHLKGKRLLLVLDNCEHVLDSCARLAGVLIRECPNLYILVSSREALGITGEQVYRVPSLSVPGPNHARTWEVLSRFEAVRLFAERARLARPDFTVNNQNAPAIASVCSRLDGIPMAIELAAARVRSLTVEEIDGKLDQRFRLLTGGSRTDLPRQQTLRSLIDWSYDLLNDREKVLLQRFSVFAGSWTLVSAEFVCCGDSVDRSDVLDLLTSLADKSLAVAEQSEGLTRYRMLETVRQYARERLCEADGEERWRDRHLTHFLEFAEEAEPHLRGGDQLSWLVRLEAEHPNLGAALEWSLSREGSPACLRLCGALQRFWTTRGHFSEAREWYGRSLTKFDAQEFLPERAKALNGAGALAVDRGDYGAARALFEESMAIKRVYGDRQGVAFTLVNLGNVASSQGDYPAARAVFEEALVLAREIDDQWCVARTLNNLGLLASNQGDFLAARARHEESLAIKRQRGDQLGIASSLNNLGLVARDQRELSTARVLLEEALGIRRELGDRWGTTISLNATGLVARDQGDNVTAGVLFKEALGIARELGDQWGTAMALHNLGLVAGDQDDQTTGFQLLRESLQIRLELGTRGGIAESLREIASMAAAGGFTSRAARIWGASERLREEIGSPLAPNDLETHVKLFEAARAASGDAAAFDDAWQEGRALPLNSAVELALG